MCWPIFVATCYFNGQLVYITVEPLKAFQAPWGVSSVDTGTHFQLDMDHLKIQFCDNSPISRHLKISQCTFMPDSLSRLSEADFGRTVGRWWWWLIGLSQWRLRESIATWGDDLLWFVSWLKDLLDTPSSHGKEINVEANIRQSPFGFRSYTVPRVAIQMKTSLFWCRSHASWHASHCGDPT